jgi:hypothetical protein
MEWFVASNFFDTGPCIRSIRGEQIQGMLDMLLYPQITVLLRKVRKRIKSFFVIVHPFQKVEISVDIGGGVLALRCIWTYYGKYIKKTNFKCQKILKINLACRSRHSILAHKFLITKNILCGIGKKDKNMSCK